MVADRRPTGQHLPMAEAHRLIGLHRRTVVAHPRIAPRPRMAVAAVVEEAEHLPITVVEAEGDVPLLAAATVAIAN